MSSLIFWRSFPSVLYQLIISTIFAISQQAKYASFIQNSAHPVENNTEGKLIPINIRFLANNIFS